MSWFRQQIQIWEQMVRSIIVSSTTRLYFPSTPVEAYGRQCLWTERSKEITDLFCSHVQWILLGNSSKSLALVQTLIVNLFMFKGKTTLFPCGGGLRWGRGPSEIHTETICHSFGCRRQQPRFLPTVLQCQPPREQSKGYGHTTIKGGCFGRQKGLYGSS